MRDWDFWDEGEDKEDYCQSVYELAKKFKPKRGLEIGVRFGKSALASMLGSPEMELIGIDPNPEYPVEEFMRNRVGNRFLFINERSPNALDRFEPEYFDWIYVDGLHDFHGVRVDFEATWPLLKKGGIMILDDYDDTLGYGTEVREMLKQYAEPVTGKPFIHKSTKDYGLHPNPHQAAILIKD